LALSARDSLLQCGEIARGPALRCQRTLNLADTLLRYTPPRLGCGQGLLAVTEPAAPLESEAPAQDRREQDDS